MKTLEQKIEVMQAALDGKEIEFKDANGDWISSDPVWNWDKVDFRIKPEPMEFWTALFNDGSCGSLYSTKEAPHRRYRGMAEYVRMIKVVEVTDEN